MNELYSWLAAPLFRLQTSNKISICYLSDWDMAPLDPTQEPMFLLWSSGKIGWLEANKGSHLTFQQYPNPAIRALNSCCHSRQGIVKRAKLTRQRSREHRYYTKTSNLLLSTCDGCFRLAPVGYGEVSRRKCLLQTKLTRNSSSPFGDSRYLLIPEKEVLLQSTNPVHYFIFLS